MNDLYLKLADKAVRRCKSGLEAHSDLLYEYITEEVVKECLSQMSDHLDKQRVLKHFGMGE
jgi:hypothetical protein